MAPHMLRRRPSVVAVALRVSGTRASTTASALQAPLSEDVAALAGTAVGGASPALAPAPEQVLEPVTHLHLGAGREPAALPRAAQARPGRALGVALRAVDLAMLAVGFVLTSWELPAAPALHARLEAGIVATVVAALVIWRLGLYRSRCCARRRALLFRQAAAVACGGGALWLVQQRWGEPQWRPIACAVAALTATVIGRWQYGRFLRARRASGRHLRRVLLVGSNADAADLRTTFASEPELGYVIAGVIAGDCVDPLLSDLPLAWSAAGIGRLAAETGASGVLLVPNALPSAAVQAAAAAAWSAGLHVQVWPGLRGVAPDRLRAVPLSGEPFFYVEPKTTDHWQVVAKRAVDIAGAALALVCTAPILVLAALLVKLDGGPAFYKGERVGMHGRRIRPLKLRTMRESHGVTSSALKALNQRTDGPLFKASADPRVTKVGRFLRSSSVDELPQLWNVLKGTMSLVGPRPALPEEAAEFDPQLRRRWSVRPGMTGLWQVEARLNPSFNAYRRLDLYYVDNWSLGLDLSILAATVPAVVSQAFRSIRRHHPCP